jgi:hypothetical protein
MHGLMRPRNSCDCQSAPEGPASKLVERETRHRSPSGEHHAVLDLRVSYLQHIFVVYVSSSYVALKSLFL